MAIANDQKWLYQEWMRKGAFTLLNLVYRTLFALFCTRVYLGLLDCQSELTANF